MNISNAIVCFVVMISAALIVGTVECVRLKTGPKPILILLGATVIGIVLGVFFSVMANGGIKL